MEFEVIQQFLNDEEEDSDNYFLQPALNPYNMTEKIAAANKLLNNNEYNLNERNVKVKFRENLVEFEPDYTSDEATEDSNYDKQMDDIDADENTIYETSPLDLDVQLQNKLNLDMAQSDDDDDEILEEIFDEDPLIIPQEFMGRPEDFFEEEIVEEDDTETLEDGNKIDEYISTEMDVQNERKKENIDPDRSKCKSRPKSERKTLKLKEANIICRDQCAENLDRCRFRMPDANSAPPKIVGPVLKLKKRKCCDQNLKPKLPIYSGMRSEYGLSPEQLEKREKLKVLTHKRGVLKKQRQEEIREIKQQENEKIFCEWLKEITRRKELELKKTKAVSTPYASPKSKTNCSKKQRPKTANEIYNYSTPKASPKKKRPHTSTACVFIEIPQKCLEKGIKIGDLLVSKKNRHVKKLHMLTTA